MSPDPIMGQTLAEAGVEIMQLRYQLKATRSALSQAQAEVAALKAPKVEDAPKKSAKKVVNSLLDDLQSNGLLA